ncbi:DNA-directed RNA polymerase subunit beta, partial [Bienertia sinuspersici]
QAYKLVYKDFQCTFIYEHNNRSGKERLWHELKEIQCHDPWIIEGDFNSLLFHEERMGAPVRDYEFQPFRYCVLQYGLDDIKTFGRFLTWNNKQLVKAKVISKIDRTMWNDIWLSSFKEVEVYYLLEGDFNRKFGRLWKDVRKVKVDKIIQGDDNTKVFSQALKAWKYQNKIHAIQNGAGVWVNAQQKMNHAFLDFSKSFLSTQMENRCKVKEEILR